MKKAWIEDGVVRDTCSGDPFELFHKDIAALYDTEVPDEAKSGDAWDGSTLTPAVIEAVVIVAAPSVVKVSPVEFKLLFTSAERLSIKAARQSNAILDDFFSIIEDPRLTEVNLSLGSTQDGIAYLSAQGLIAESRVAEILSGAVK